MIRLSWCLVTVLLCVVAGCDTVGGASGSGDTDPADDMRIGIRTDDEDGAAPPIGDGDTTSTGYRKVTLAGTVTTDNNEATVELEPGEGMTLFEYIGDYQMEFWFPMGGGEVVQQRCWIALREGGYIPVYYGIADECDYSPHADAYEEREMTLEATLTLNGLLLDDEPADELAIHLPVWPMDIITVTVQCPFGVPADTLDPGPYTQLQLHWHMDTIVQAVQLDEVSTDTWTDIPMMPPYDMFYLNVSQNLNYEIVPTL